MICSYASLALRRCHATCAQPPAMPLIKAALTALEGIKLPVAAVSAMAEGKTKGCESANDVRKTGAGSVGELG